MFLCKCASMKHLSWYWHLQVLLVLVSSPYNTMISYFLFLCDKFIVCWIFSYISHPETMCAWNTKDDIDSNWTLEPLARLHYRCCLEKNVIPQTPFKVQICNANKCKAIVIRRVLFYLALTENQWVCGLGICALSISCSPARYTN